MKNRVKLGEMVIACLEKSYRLRQEEIGADACLSAKGMRFSTRSYTVEGVGHLCVMEMTAMLGLMKMETVVLSCTEKDLPLVNWDWICVLGKETQIVELYDTQLSPLPQNARDAFARLQEADSDLDDYSAGQARWYDEILYPFSYRKKAGGKTQRLSRAAEAYLAQFAALLADAPACDRAAKGARVRAFAERLFAEGGPAVDQVSRLFGRETAGRLVLRHMYGLDDDGGVRT